MAIFETLSNELLFQIFGYLSGETLDLAHLCRVSRRLRWVATDELYKTLEHGWYHTELLLRTLIENPHIAARVHMIDMHAFADEYDDDNSDDYYRGSSQPSLENLMIYRQRQQLVGQCVQLLVRGPQEDFRSAVKQSLINGLGWGSDTSFAGMILAVLPQLQCLKIALYEHYDEVHTCQNPLRELYGLDPTHDFLSQWSATPAFYDNIRQLDIPGGNFSFFTYFGFPQLASLTVNLAAREYHNDFHAEPNRRRSPHDLIHDLRVRLNPFDMHTRRTSGAPLDELVDALHLEQYSERSLGAVNKLELVLITEREHGGMPPISDLFRNGSFELLLSRFRDTSSSLVELRVDVEAVRCCTFTCLRDGHLRFIRPIVSLSHFHSLRRLEVVQEVIMDDTVRRHPHMSIDFQGLLPPNLEKLTILYPDGRMVPWLNQLATASSAVPVMKEIELCCVSSYGRQASWFEDRLGSASKLLRNRHITLAISDLSCTEPHQHRTRSFYKPVWERRERFTADWENDWSGMRALFDGAVNVEYNA